jgi:hypothetical protein
VFQTFAKTKADDTQLIKIAADASQPDTLFLLPGIKTLIKKAANGSNTVVKTNWMVRVSMSCKKLFNV